MIEIEFIQQEKLQRNHSINKNLNNQIHNHYPKVTKSIKI